MGRLPARDIGDVRLADFVEAGGCPVCAACDDAVKRLIDEILWESVNDVGFRRELDAARGFCPPHAVAVLDADRRQSGGAVGAAILYGAILGGRLRELERSASARGRTRRRRTELASAPPDCPACAVRRDAETGTIRRLGVLTNDAAWRDALGSAETCLTHLARLIRDAPDTDEWRAVERLQLDRLRDVAARLRGFVDHSGQDRRDLMTDDERRAVEEARRLLGGAA